MSRVRRAVRFLAWAGLALVVLLGTFAGITALTAPGRRGLEGAEERARDWGRQPSLRELADRVGVRFGSAVTARDLRSDPQYGPVLAREFNSLTPFVEMKWGTMSASRDTWYLWLAGPR